MVLELRECCRYNIGSLQPLFYLSVSPSVRMHDNICQFPSKTLYGSQLKSDPSVSARLLSDLPNVKGLTGSTNEDSLDVLSHPVVFYDTAGSEYFERLEGDSDEGSRCNENEATLVKDWVAQLVSRNSSRTNPELE